MCILPPAPPAAHPTPSPARTLLPQQRQQLAVDALAGRPIAALADEQHVSRKFVYQQLQHAHDALDQAFAPPQPPVDDLLFWLPVTKTWVQQLTLGLVLICHSSVRGVTELLADLFDYSLSVGSVHNLLTRAVARARMVNDRQDLAGVRIGAHDEIFQAGRPVVVGACAETTYCYLLSQEEHRDADTWGVRLLELVDRRFQPQATIADFAGGLRAAQAQVLPAVPCRGDVFHVLHEAVPLVTYLENRAYDALTARSKLERQQAEHERRQGRRKATLAQKLRYARAAEAQAITLADDVALLVRWFRQDLLSVAGPDHATRGVLYDWLVAELRAREPSCPHRIGPVRRLLENQRDDLLAFVATLDRDLAAVAAELEVPVAAARETLQVQALPLGQAPRWHREEALWQRWGARYPLLRDAVAALASQVVRASSVIENLNSRLRGYFFLRRQLGPDYLALLQFFLNHRRFLRSEHPGRVGKSPAELLTGQTQPHWLEVLGYRRFSRN